ncbi:CDGSH iron-sulfur domain-containing protein [Streptomyces sp. NBC_01619]|uniref:CDGSH iron-sulfur domain-containing protein n=1 Tax=Streptomyces pratisoli TaxID=3139917 RepID=A0ACC6QSX6_9ACTN|nr:MULTISPECIES: CDGSH iron-sulfur domain-containing protein [unclassified Streptomyces]MCX4513833.1 CDGSH iron-sulfur domain-containing protein [Streptomyces sp. NBC_01619]
MNEPRDAAYEPRREPCASRDAPRRIRMRTDGPLLVEGPVEIVMEDGTTLTSDRFCVALCTCRRSRRFPWCDTSHRRRARE